MEKWQPIETAPRDGTHFLAVCVDLVDEYDERNRILERGKREEYLCVAYHIDWLGGTVQFPFNGGIVQNRRFTHWMPLPAPPKQELV